MIHNSYAALLQHDVIKIKHPDDPTRIITLYRIIATKSFTIKKYDLYIDNYTVGGYVESIDNLDTENPVWIGNRARVFDKAKILNDSYVSDQALIYNDAIIDNCRIENYSRIHGKALVSNSHVADITEIKGNAQVDGCMVMNSSLIFENARVKNSKLSEGVSVRGTVQLDNCQLSDLSQCNGDAVVTNCVFKNAGAVKTGVHTNSTFDSDPNLKYIAVTE